MDSISSGLSRDNPPALSGTPSITTSASLLLNDPVPLIYIGLSSYPGCGEPCLTTRPGTVP